MHGCVFYVLRLYNIITLDLYRHSILYVVYIRMRGLVYLKVQILHYIYALLSFGPGLWAHLNDSRNANDKKKLGLEKSNCKCRAHQHGKSRLQNQNVASWIAKSNFIPNKIQKVGFLPLALDCHDWLPNHHPLSKIASGSTKKLPLTLASRLSFTNSAAESAYSWWFQIRPDWGIFCPRARGREFKKTFGTT